MKFAFGILVALAIAAVTYISTDPFFIAGGSDSSEQIVQLPEMTRFFTAGLAIVAVLYWMFRSSLLMVLISLAAIAAFALAHNTLRVSGKSFEVVQTTAFVPFKRFPVEEGREDLTPLVFKGVGLLTLSNRRVSDALSGLKRAE